jgi:CheY-like chemotaxis protein
VSQALFDRTSMTAEEVAGFIKNIIESSTEHSILAEDLRGEIAQANTPSLIISDLHMPGCNGVELLEIVKGDQELRRIPFVLISATGATADEQRRAAASGADGFLRRPLDPETILAHLTRWIPTES